MAKRQQKKKGLTKEDWYKIVPIALTAIGLLIGLIKFYSEDKAVNPLLLKEFEAKARTQMEIHGLISRLINNYNNSDSVAILRIKFNVLYDGQMRAAHEDSATYKAMMLFWQELDIRDRNPEFSNADLFRDRGYAVQDRVKEWIAMEKQKLSE